MDTPARRPDAPACGREQTAIVVAPRPTPADVPAGTPDLARHSDALRAVPPVRPGGPAVPLTEVHIIITTTGVAR